MEQCVYTVKQLKAMQAVDVREADPATLRDIRDVKVNTDLPKQERIMDFMRQIGNPYCYRHGKYVRYGIPAVMCASAVRTAARRKATTSRVRRIWSVTI